MQQEIHSYAFQLGEECISTSVASNPKQLAFYASAVHTQHPHSFLYSLYYNEDNPRKSELQCNRVDGHIKNIFTSSEQHMYLSVSSQGKECLQSVSFDKLSESRGKQVDLHLLCESPESICHFVAKEKNNEIFIGGKSRVALYNADKMQESQEIVSVKGQGSVGHCTIDPIHDYFTYTLNNQLHVLDKNNAKQKYSFKLSFNEKEDILSIDYNRNKQYYLMSTHHDLIKFWDIRKTNIPVKCLDNHHSLLLNACYNHSHDELLIGSYDDGTVGLYRMTSVSTVPSRDSEDTLVKLYDEHEDSVYHLCWSAFSPWVFSSVSYGACNLVINIVPSVEKYRILL